MRRVTGYLEYITREGDTFDALALQMYNEETLAHYIIEFNPDYADVLTVSYTHLTLPTIA